MTPPSAAPRTAHVLLEPDEDPVEVLRNVQLKHAREVLPCEKTERDGQGDIIISSAVSTEGQRRRQRGSVRSGAHAPPAWPRRRPRRTPSTARRRSRPARPGARAPSTRPPAATGPGVARGLRQRAETPPRGERRRWDPRPARQEPGLEERRGRAAHAEGGVVGARVDEERVQLLLRRRAGRPSRARARSDAAAPLQTGAA